MGLEVVFDAVGGIHSLQDSLVNFRFPPSDGQGVSLVPFCMTVSDRHRVLNPGNGVAYPSPLNAMLMG